MSRMRSWKSRAVMSKRSKRAKSYIVKQKVRIKGLDLDKISKIRFKVRPEVKIEEVLDF